MKFRKKPVVIEARQLTDESMWDVYEWANGVEWQWDDEEKYFIIRTLEGDHKACEGDWVIQGVKGEFYPCKPDIFEATYEPADKEVKS